MDDRGRGELDLHPVVATREFDFKAFFPAFIAIGDIGEIAGSGFLGTRGHGRTFGQVNSFGRDFRQHARGLGNWLEVIDLHRLRGAEGHGLRQDERQGLLFGNERERQGEQTKGEDLQGHRIKTSDYA